MPVAPTEKALELWSTGTNPPQWSVILPDVEGNLSDMLLRLMYPYGWKVDINYAPPLLYVGTMGDIDDQSRFVPFDTIRKPEEAFKKVV